MRVVLFGAGASFGSIPFRKDEDLRSYNPYRPPLGNFLFDVLEKSYPRWNRLPGDAKAEFRRDGNFENGFPYIRSRMNLDFELSGLLRDMGSLFLSYKLHSESLYIDFCHVTRLINKKCFVATLNYDLLIDMAIAKTRINHPVSRLGVVKVHGASNILPDTGGFSVSNFRSSMGNAIVEAPVKILTASEAEEELRLADARNNDTVAPVMALYAEGKAVMHSQNFVKQSQSIFEKMCMDADEIYLVGMRVANDPHVWGPLINTAASLKFVNPSQDDCLKFDRWTFDAGVKNRSSIIQDSFSGFVDILRKEIRYV